MIVSPADNAPVDAVFHPLVISPGLSHGMAAPIARHVQIPEPLFDVPGHEKNVQMVFLPAPLPGKKYEIVFRRDRIPGGIPGMFVDGLINKDVILLPGFFLDNGDLVAHTVYFRSFTRSFSKSPARMLVLIPRTKKNKSLLLPARYFFILLMSVSFRIGVAEFIVAFL